MNLVSSLDAMLRRAGVCEETVYSCKKNCFIVLMCVNSFFPNSTQAMYIR